MLTLTLTAARLREERGKSIEKVVACEGTTNRIDLIVIIHISCLSMLEFLHIFNLFEYPKHFILTTDVRCKPRDLFREVSGVVQRGAVWSSAWPLRTAGALIHGY